MPGAWLFQYSLANGGSVPFFCVTAYCSPVSFFLRASSSAGESAGAFAVSVVVIVVSFAIGFGIGIGFDAGVGTVVALGLGIDAARSERQPRHGLDTASAKAKPKIDRACMPSLRRRAVTVSPWNPPVAPRRSSLTRRLGRRRP